MADEPRAYKLFNVIVAIEPGRPHRTRAISLLKTLLLKARVFSELQSLVLLKVEGDPYEAVAALASRLGRDDPILRVIPVDAVTPPYPEDVASVAVKLVEDRADGSSTFAVKIEGHLYDKESGRRLHKLDAIRVIAERIELPVNLNDPSLLILVKTVRLTRSLSYAAVMVAPPCAVYSKAKNPAVCRPWWL